MNGFLYLDWWDGPWTMALQDHFQPPLSIGRHWHAFHHAWANYLAADLNRLLPEGYFAEPKAQFGIEIDVATFADFPLAEDYSLNMVDHWGSRRLGPAAEGKLASNEFWYIYFVREHSGWRVWKLELAVHQAKAGRT